MMKLNLKMKTENNGFVRINKFIASNTGMSRRDVDEYIRQGRITVNNITVRDLGFKINPETDKVAVDGVKVKVEERKIYIMLNKPEKVITTKDDEKKRQTVMDFIDINIPVFPVGRLDYDTSGLLLLTNDGDFANDMMHPTSEVKKTYQVKLSKPLNDRHLAMLQRGIMLERKKTLPCEIKFTDATDKRNLNITISEGRNRQIRKMFEALGYFVNKLKRISYGNLRLGSLKKGEWRMLTQKEITELKNLKK